MIALAGFEPGTPVSLARRDASGAIEDGVAGTWPDGRPVVATDRFYGASLAKQVTGAAAALLVRDGRLDPDQSVARHLTDLPPWAAETTPRQLAHHTAGLPAAGVLEVLAPGDWTEDFAIGAMRGLPGPVTEPGTSYAYSNLGYILLAQVAERVAGMPFAAFVAANLLAPLGLQGMALETQIGDFPQSGLMGPSLPLSHGDGGLWTTSGAFALWLHQQNRDALGIADIVEASGRLAGGADVAYGWGLGLRTHRDQRLLIHGGSWTGAVAKAVRCPALGISVVALAASGQSDTLYRLVDTVLNDASG